MKKMIGRKVYNTDTADVVAIKSGGKGEESFDEWLYKTFRGDFFVAGSGGSLTRWRNKNDIISLNDEQVKYWIKKHGLEKKVKL